MRCRAAGIADEDAVGVAPDDREDGGGPGGSLARADLDRESDQLGGQCVGTVAGRAPAAGIERTLDEFEKTAWAGLDPDRYAWSAVLHRENNGGVHVHVLAARCDLETGRSLNIAPPGWQKSFDPLRDALNHEHEERSMAGTSTPGGLSERLRKRREEEERRIEAERQRYEALITNELEKLGASASSAASNAQRSIESALEDVVDRQVSALKWSWLLPLAARDHSLSAHLAGELGAGAVAVEPDPGPGRDAGAAGSRARGADADAAAAERRDVGDPAARGGEREVHRPAAGIQDAGSQRPVGGTGLTICFRRGGTAGTAAPHDEGECQVWGNIAVTPRRARNRLAAGHPGRRRRLQEDKGSVSGKEVGPTGLGVLQNASVRVLWPRQESGLALPETLPGRPNACRGEGYPTSFASLQPGSCPDRACRNPRDRCSRPHGTA